MKYNLSLDRWFVMHVGAVLVAAMIAVASLGGQAQASEEFSAFDPAEEIQMPTSVPMGFGGFDNDVLLGHELEALEELEATDVDSDEGGAVQDATARALPPTPSPGV